MYGVLTLEWVRREVSRLPEHPRPWVASIRGRNEAGKYIREFVQPLYDATATHKNRRSSRLIFILSEGVYETAYSVSWDRHYRYFFRIDEGGELHLMNQPADSYIRSRSESPLPPSFVHRQEKLSNVKKYLGCNVLEASRQRIAWAFDVFPRIYVSFSGGKDSTVMLHLVAQEAQSRGRKIGVLFVDLEGQYKLTIDHIQLMYDLYADVIEPFWCCVPIALRNAVSMYEPKWCAWEPGRKADWIRQPPEMAIIDKNEFPFFRERKSMEFEEFVPAFGEWYSQLNEQEWLTACFVGIRTDESLNRWRTIAGHGTKLEGHHWTNHVLGAVWNVYPIYDWKSEDIWIYHGKTNQPYNRLYDRMHQAGLSIHQQRICQPYGDDQRKGLWLFHIIEPETWSRIVARVNGANQGALYARTTGNILGNLKIDKPEGHTWESFAMLLLGSMPEQMSEHYKDKIALFLKWYRDRGYPDGIPDELDYEIERHKAGPSWRRICKTLLRNDYWCKGLGFSMQKGGPAQARYKELMAKRRNQWGIFPLSD